MTHEATALRHWLPRCAASFPERPALIDAIRGDAWTYAALWARVQSATEALRESGLGAGDRLGIAAARHPDTLVWILAAIDAGVGYVPFDLDYPTARLQAMADDAAPRAVVGDADALAALQRRLPGLPTLAHPAPATRPHAAGDDLAYVLFTSGSSGRPKGVAMGEGPIARLIDWQVAHPRLGDAAATLLFAPFSFDVHVQEIFGAVATGGTLVLVDDATRRDPAALRAAIRAHGVQRLYLPYVALQMLADASDDGAPLPLRDVVSAGEALVLTPAIRALFARLPDARLHNHYGPTESHVVTAHTLPADVEGWPAVAPIGAALPHVRVLPGPAGEDGGRELLLAGECLAYGYLGRADLDEGRFITVDGLRAYATGDLGDVDGDGVWTYRGRRDAQLKIDGFRIEPGEVEAALLGLPGLAEAAVDAIDVDGLRSLAAWVVCRDGAAPPDAATIRRHLQDRVPDAWIPLKVFVLAALPKTPSGKLDRRALPRPADGSATASDDEARRGAGVAPPATAAERRALLLALWRDALGLRDLDPQRSVFDAGARSLLVLRVLARLRERGLTALGVADIYDAPSVAAQSERLEVALGGHAASTATRRVRRAAGGAAAGGHGDGAIAIVGMAVRAAGCPDVDAFWQALLEGRDGLHRFDDAALDPSVPASMRAQPNFVPARGVLEQAECFDAGLFGVPAREARLLDPQQRLLLELSWAALEDAAIDPTRDPDIGVWAGTANNSYAPALRREAPQLVEQSGEFAAMLASEKDYVATRIAHRLDLRGPAVSVHTACSTGLVAVAEAVEALRAGRCGVALAGGATVLVPQAAGYLHVEGGMESADGQCRPFEAAASGTVFASAGAVVVLKPLAQAIADGDRIHAVIRGVGVNNDGAAKASFTAPSARGQQDAIRRALDDAGVDAASIGFVEAHGTGTALGDPIEVRALAEAHGTQAAATPCWLGSLKSGFGHTIAAAGVLGLIKAALALREGMVPGTRHFRAANPAIGLEATRFRVTTAPQPWPRGEAPRRAAVSSFGVGGTNAHLVLEEVPVLAEPRGIAPLTSSAAPTDAGTAAPTPRLLPICAASESALDALAARLADAIVLRPDDAEAMAEVQATLVRGRRVLPVRACVVANDARDAAVTLRARRAPVRAAVAPRVVWLFPGQGAQHAGMAAALHAAFPVFRDALDEALAALRPWRGDALRGLLLDAPKPAADAALADTANAQPALFAMGFAMARWLGAQGVRADAMIGHSVGEIAAACAAGALSLEDAARAVCARADAMAAQPRGAMAAVRASADAVAARLAEGLDIAGINAPELTVVAGPDDILQPWLAGLAADGIEATALRVSHAFHSASMDGALPAITAAFASARTQPAGVPVYSSCSGRPHDATSLADAEGWARQVREPVRFADAITHAAADGETVFVELGPGQALSALVRQARPRGTAPRVVPLLPTPGRGADAARHALEALGQLWCHGVELAWPIAANARRAPLPTYPFARDAFWFERAVAGPAAPVAPPTSVASAMTDRLPHLAERLRAVFADIAGTAPERIDPALPFLDQDFDSLTLTQAALEVGRVFGHAPRLRQLMEDLDHIDALARHLDGMLPADAHRPAAAPASGAHYAAAAPSAMVSAAIPAAMQAGLAPVSAGDLVGLMSQQLALMQQTLALVAGGAAPLAASAATSPASAAAPASPAPSALPATPDLKAQPFGASARITLKPQSTLDAAQSAWLRDFTARYLAKTGRSRTYSQQHRDGMADPRVVTGFNPAWKDLVYPIVADGSDGATVTDLDGNTYIDLLSCFGANLLGYKPKALTAAMHAQLDRGIEVGPQHPLAGDVARKIAAFTGHQRVAFCNTGSEAVMGAMRIARTVTGRKTIAIFTNSYHGIFDEVIVRGTPMLRSLAAAPGILASAVENVLVLDYGSDESLRVLRERGHELAAIMLEPVQNKLPTFQPVEFVRALRGIADASGCALIFDEVVTGFRLGAGGAQEFYGVRADLCTYGKIIGGGLPLAAIAGSRQWMDALDGGTWRYGDDSIPEAGVTYFAGTFVRHPLALAAANATLDVLAERGPALYATLAARTQSLVDRLNDGFRARGAPVEAVHCASLWRLRWDDGERYVSLFYYLTRFHGLHLYEQFGHFVTDAMDDAVIARIGDVFLACLDELMALGFIRPRGGAAITHAPGSIASATALEFPLGPGQTERWLAAQVCTEALVALNETLSIDLEGELDLPALRAAIGDLQARHEAFRTVILADAPRQRVVPGSEQPLSFVDLSTARDPDAALRAATDAAGQRAFALGRESMIAMHLFRLGPTRHVLHLVCSHLVFDGWASTVVVDELAALYRARRDGHAAALPAPDRPGPFAAEEQARMAGPQGQASADFWRAAMTAPPAPPQLGDREPRGPRSFAADTAVRRIDGPRTQRLRALGRERRMTLFQVLLGAVAKLVVDELRQDEVVLGIPYASQGLGKHASLVADGVLDLPLRLRLGRQADVLDCAAKARAALMDALEHPLVTQGLAARLVAAPSRGDRPPLTGVFFNLNPRVAVDGFAPLRARVYEGRKPGLLGKLVFNFYEDDDGLLLDLHHSTEFFSESRIAVLLDRLDALLDAAIATPGMGSAVAQPATAAAPRVEALVAAQVAKAPERIALSSGDERWTYAELDARANRIAHALVERGVRPGDWVGLCLPRSPDLVAALLGVLKCGAAYVPLDPAFPLQRLRDMAEDAGIALLLSDAENAARLALDGLPTLRLDADAGAVGRAPATAPPAATGPDAPAYVIYTSGSTGKPKGVVVLHGGVVNFLRSMAHTPGLGADERLLAVTTLSFDIAVLELLLPLTVGAEVVLAQRTDAIDGEALKQLIAARGIRLMQATPSTWHLLIEAGFQAPAGFRALCGGEALSPALARRLLDAGVAALWNMYGPTETTVWSTVARVVDPDAISVGRPIDATVVRILDERNRECAVGEAGEICIGGAGVAQGYHARPELTAERFIADPFDARPGARLYRTGDLGAWNADGTIRHLGRLDHQVKLRGYRIELGEIEAALERLPSIARAAMRVESFGPMDDRLVAYVVAAPGASLPNLATLRRELGQRLPDYMLPQVLKPLDAMPLLPNGKIDRKALGAPIDDRPNDVRPTEVPPTDTAPPGESAASDTGLAAELGVLMGELLQREPLGPEEHFFELGGHSLLAAELATAVQRRRGARPTLRTLFEAPTPSRLAAALTASAASRGPGAGTRTDDDARALPPLAPRRDDGPAPLSAQQLSAWFVEQTSVSGSVNLLPSAHRLLGPFDATRFQRVLDAIVSRQSALRTVFHPSADGVEQVVLAPSGVDCPTLDLSTHPHADAEAEVIAAVRAMQAEPIDLAAGPPFRCALFRLGVDEHVFVFVVHHLVWDGWSFDLLYREFAAQYAADHGTAAAPAPLAIEYVDFCEWQHAVLASGQLAPQIEQWRTRLLPLPAPLALPTNRPRPPHFSGRGASVHRHVEPSQVEALHALARRHRTTLFVVLLAVHAAALRRWSGQDDVVVGTPVRGREAGDLLDVMGFFVNALPLRFPAPATTLDAWIEHVGQVAAEGFGAPDVPIEALVRELHAPRDPSRPALFQSMFSYQDTRGRPESWGELRHERFAVPITGASHELSLWCVETPKGLELVFTYSTDLFDAARVAAWVDEFEAALSKLVHAPPAAALGSLWGDADAMETLLAGVWRELLGVDDVGPDDNFFDRGGHSLLALTMVSRVELASGKRLPLLRVGDSSLRALAAMLREDAAAPAPAAGPASGAKSLGGWLRRLVGQPEA